MKKVLALVLAACMVMSLAACSSSSTTKAAETTAAAKAETTAAKAAETTAAAKAAETTAAAKEEATVGLQVKTNSDGTFQIWDADAPEQEATGDPIVIGGFGALTGTSAAGGNGCYRGVELATEWINAHGGINGRPLEVTYYDDATTPEGAVKAVTRLIDEDEVPIILGGHISPDVLAAMDYTESQGVPMIGVGTGLSWTRCDAEYTFRGTFSGYSLYPTLLSSMEELGTDNVAFFYAENDFGQAAEKYFIEEKALENAGIEVVETVSYPKAETDFTGHIAKALAKNPKAILIISAANTEYSLFVKQLRQQGFTGLVYGPENVGSKAVIETAGELADGSVYALSIMSSADPDEYEDGSQGEYMVARFKEKYGEDLPGEGGFRGWDQTMLAAYALLVAEDPTDSEELTDILWNLKGYVGLQGTFDFTTHDGEGLQSLRSCMIMDQKFQYIDYDVLKDWAAKQ